MKFDILNRITCAVQFSAEIECRADELPSVKIGLAVKVAFKQGAYLRGADLQGADLRGADLRGADLQGADLRGADLQGAYLRGADLRGADLQGADLRGAYLQGADLRGADLRGAYLQGADLRCADLRGAYLRGADLRGQWIIQGATRSDGHAFFLQKLKDDKEPMVKAGCRYFTLTEAQSHWTATRGGTPLGRETEAIIRGMVDLAHIRKLMPAAQPAEALAA